MKNIKTIIIQAGGKGTRIFPYSKNKPKILLPVNGKNILQSFLNSFVGCRFIIIGDYKFDILSKYVETLYNKENITLIKAKNSGNSSGLQEALTLIGEEEPFIYTWSDLLFEKKPSFQFNNRNIIGLSNTFKCRYSYIDEQIIKKESTEEGIAGFFVFKDKKEIIDVEDGCSFVSGFLKNKNISFEKMYLSDCYELGTLENIEEYNQKNKFSRFFNTISFEKNNVVKEVIDKKYSDLLNGENEWYKEIEKEKLNFIPKTSMKGGKFYIKKINGKHAFDLDIQEKDKSKIVKNCIEMLSTLHQSKEKRQFVKEDYKSLFFDKTKQRINSVKNLIPFYEDDEIQINDKFCANPFSEKYYHIFEEQIQKIAKEEYSFIHGDCTFSNILVDDNLNTYLIDPRGKFGDTKFFGDKKYDYSKLYYSIVGNYDSINAKKYDLSIFENKVQFEIKSNGYENQQQLFFDLIDAHPRDINLIHSLIWLSLSGYVIEDYDAILLSFYNGIKIWNEINDF